MEAGASVVLYTDGLVERPGDGDRRRDRPDSPPPSAASAEPGGCATTCSRTLVPDGGPTDDVALLAVRNVPMTDRIQSGVPDRPGGAVVDARVAASLAALRGRRRSGDRRDRYRLRRGGDQRDRARRDQRATRRSR